MRLSDLITRKLTEAFAPESVRVIDESNQHEGHAGHRPAGESHFRLYIVSEAFRGKSRPDPHKARAGCCGLRPSGVIRNPVMRLRSRRSTWNRNPWNVKLWPGSGIERAS